MKKNLSLMSIVAISAIFSACGGSSGDPADTVAPKFTNSSFVYDVPENSSIDINLTTDEAATFTENSSESTISGSVLTFTAPPVTADEDIVVTVTARDEAGNSTSQNFTFKVINQANHVSVLSTGDKSFEVLSDDSANLMKILRDSTGLIWRDKRSNDDGDLLTHAEAASYCSSKTYDGKAFRLPTRNEVLNLINYVRTHSEEASLLDADFTYNGADDENGKALVAGVWTKTDPYYVHTVGGVDVKETDTTKKHTVICVQGEEEAAHTITVGTDSVVDSTTGYEWTKVAVDKNGTYNTASDVCPAGYVLPNVNELRSMYNYTTMSLNGMTSDGTTGLVWTDTEDPKNSTQAYVINLEGNASLTVAPKDQTHFVVCVKKPSN